MTESRKVYVDYNATTPLKDEVREAMIRGFDIYGNASSLHSSGRAAAARIEEARKSVALLCGAPDECIVFMSGGSEANNTVFATMRHHAADCGQSAGQGRREFIISAIEHPCVMKAAEYTKSRGFPVHIIPVDEGGKIKMDAYRGALSGKTLLVSVMMANNEIGTIQDIKEITRLAHEAGAFVHTDAVQALGKIPLDTLNLGVDYLSVSSHKIYGPKGVGALYRRALAPLDPLIHGGHQEEGLRAGTYNTTGILGFGVAAHCALRDLGEYQSRMRSLRNLLREGLLASIPAAKINGHEKDSLPNTLSVSFPGAEGEAILLSMDMAGIEASTGSACASGSLDPSHVLLAIGLGPELSHSSIRFSLGWGTTEDDINYIIERMPTIISRLRAMSTMK